MSVKIHTMKVTHSGYFWVAMIDCMHLTNIDCISEELVTAISDALLTGSLTHISDCYL